MDVFEREIINKMVGLMGSNHLLFCFSREVSFLTCDNFLLPSMAHTMPSGTIALEFVGSIGYVKALEMSSHNE
jgi:hypothetical protein